MDLLYVSNFKGGNTIISKSEEMISEKLNLYGQLFSGIIIKFENKKLHLLNIIEVNELSLSELIMVV
jgi:hypothetical protein